MKTKNPGSIGMTFKNTTVVTVPGDVDAHDLEGPDFYCNDWFVYVVDRPDGTSTQLLGSSDGSYVLSSSMDSNDQQGMLTLEQRQTIESLLAPDAAAAYLADSEVPGEVKFEGEPPTQRCLMWLTPDRSPSVGCWRGGNLSAATQALLTTFDRLITTLRIGRPRFPARRRSN
jgi:hypothetical protein